MGYAVVTWHRISDTYTQEIYFETVKYLFQDGDTIKRYSDGTWVDVGPAPVTQTMFDTYGMDSLVGVNISTLVAPQLLVWTDGTNSKTCRLTATPYPKLVLASGDIRLDYIENIDGFILTYNQSGSGLIRLIVSVDGGVTWKTYSNGTWSTINHNNLAEVRANGIPPNVFNFIPSTDWMTLIGTSKTIRFGYYLEMDAATDAAATDKLSAQFDMLGSWDLAQPYVDFSYRYTNNSTVQVKLFANGSYKVNYQS